MRKLYMFLLLFVSGFINAQTTVAIVADKDNTIYSAFPDNSNGAGGFFFAGKNSPNNQSSVQRALLHFDLSSIPAGAVITDATLTVFVGKSAANSTGIELHKMTADWGEGTSDAAGNEGSGAAATTTDATWSKRMFPSTAWATAGGDFSVTVSASVASINSGISSPTAITLSGPNVVTDVQSWINDPSSNFGWTIVSSDETVQASVKRFISRNSSITADRPSLSVTYTTNLPVTLKGFSASLHKQSIVLQWTTATEIDNEYFVIEHSFDGKNFASVGQVKAAGTSTTEHAYTFEHQNIAFGKHFYRLNQVDKNGNRHYSSVILLSLGDAFKLQLFPNPAGSFISVTAASLLRGNEFTINSLTGQVLLKGKINDQQINVQKLAAGQYWLTIKTSSGELLKAQFMKQ